jgi:hypothetical protein
MTPIGRSPVLASAGRSPVLASAASESALATAKKVLLPQEEIARRAAAAKYMEKSNAPPVMYHATNQDRMSGFSNLYPEKVSTDKFGSQTVKQFSGTRGNPEAPVVGYAAFDPAFAERHAGFNNIKAAPQTALNRQISVYPVKVKATNIFDIANPEHRKMVGIEKDPIRSESFMYQYMPDNKYSWNWMDLEHNSDKIKKAGFDSYYDYEHGINSHYGKTGIGVFDPRQIKSEFARKYDPEHPDMGENRGGFIHKAEGGTVLSGGFTGPSAIASAPAQRISIPALPTMQSVIGGNSFQMYAPTVASRPDYDHSSVFAPVAAAPSAALQRQYPTATADQLNEYERAIAGGGDPKATRSLMQAYGPASGVKELQPWSSEFKGFDYARSRPVDDFGNPIGWSAPDRTPPTTGADGVPSGWDARDWENMKNFDPGNPSDEYILNNPWNYGMDTLGNPGPLTLGYPSQRAEERSSTGPGIAEAKALYQSNKNVESQRQAAMAQNAAALGDPNDYAESYPGSPTQPAYGYTAPWANQPAAQPAAGQSAPKSSSSSLPSNFSFGNLGQVGAKILGLTPLGIPITLANSILTGTNTIPQAQTTGSRVLDQAATQGPITNFLAKNVVNPVSQFFGGSPMPKARGGSIFDPDPEKTIRKALMLAYGGATFLPIHGYANGGMPDDPNPRAVIGDNNPPEPMLQPKQDTGDISPKTEPTYSESRVLVRADGPGPNVKGIVVPQHLLDGGKGKNDTWIDGMNVVNKARERVYGSEPRQPLNVGKIAAIHKDILSEHFAKPIEQQMADERAALQRLRDAKHLSKDADTLDKSDKLDTINYETGPNGEKYTAFGSKGIAGHALYHVGNGEYKIVNTCAGATDACSGGVSKEGIVDTLKGNCFAPNAENQYAAAAVKRTCHEQAKHDPAMTSDFILAHTGSLRNAVRVADKQGKHLLFRPNTLDETDRSSVNVIKNLNDQRKLAGLPMIITNAYSKAGDFHDPENGTFRTYSNVGPKVKFGHSVREHYARDNGRIRETISAANPNGSDFANEQGNKTPAKNSYFVTDVPRFSDLDQKMRDSITHVKYWSAGVPVDKLKKELAGEDEEAHYDGSGNLTSPDKSHYGHITYNGRRYDYQRQHVLHPRFVQTGVDSDGKPKLTPTDSRFLDDYFLPEERYMTKNGKKAGAILMTTPTTSTKGAKLYSPFMHHVGDDEIQNALNNNGEYEVDAPRLQEEARGKEYNLDAVLPKRFKKRKADGGAVDHDDFEDGSEEYMSAFPEQSFFAQRHNAHRVTPHEYM